MAGVSAKISVLDASTPVINHIYRGVSQLISGFYKLNKTSSSAIDMSPFLEAQQSMAEALAVQKSLIKENQSLGESYKSLGENINQTNNEQKMLNSSLSTGATNATAFGDKLVGGMKKYIAMAATAFGGKQLIDASDTWINNSSRMGLLTNSLLEQKVLQQEVYQSALKSRGVYNDTVNVVSRLGLLAPDAFTNNHEIVKFTELMNKSFKISGATTEEKTSAMYQLTQAMASGRLQGDEFRSIIENAPMLANAIAEYTGVGREGLKDLSSDGAISADIIKNALFGAADDIESKFSQLPMTFSDVWTNIGNGATMAFAPLYEQMNGILNNGIVKSAVEEIPNLFEKASLKAQELMSVFEGSVIVGSTNFDDIANSAGNVANAIFSANGVAGNFIRTIGTIASNPATARSLTIMGGGFLTVANAIEIVLRVATPLAPTITSTYVAFKMYNTVYPVLNNVATGIVGIVQNANNMATALNSAKTAQEGLNAVMGANPYFGVASAIAKVIAMMISLIGAIKAVNNAADLAKDSGADATIEAIDYSKKHNVSLSTAQSIIGSNESYTKQIDELSEANKTIKAKEYQYRQMYNQLNATGRTGQSQAEILARQEHQKEILTKINELEERRKTNLENIVKLGDAKRDAERNYKTIDYNTKKASNSLNAISTDPNDYYKDFDGNFDVDNVKNVDHINDTVDIASEDLRYIRDIADQEAINQFTNKLLQPQINVNFGEVRETADVDEIIERITTGLDESLNNSSDLLHI